MSAAKRDLGDSLDAVTALSTTQIDKLRALSVTTVDEMLGLIAADPDAAASFLEVDLPQVQADAFRLARSEFNDQVAAAEPQFAMGALPPDDVAVEERASSRTFAEYAVRVVGTAAAPSDGAEGSGVSLLSCFGPVRQQGKRGTCVAHAVCAALECLASRHNGATDLSEQFAYWNAKEHDGKPQASGTYIKTAIDCAAADGVPLEELWPYNPLVIPGNEGQAPPPQPAVDGASANRATGVTHLDARDAAAMRAVLDDGRPLALSIPVYKNWYDNPATRLYGTIPMPLPNSALVGGHAMCVAGYDYADDFTGGGYFIVRNSWGTDWGSSGAIAPGYGALPFAYVEQYGWEAATAT
jgi:C1A family cysteine protease